MTRPSFVLIHGGSLNGRYWDLVIPELEHPALAPDLPGRGDHPTDPNAVTIADCVTSVVSDIEEAGLDDIILAGNSLAGLVMPGVATRLKDRVRHLFFSSCTVPAQGERALDVLRPDIRDLVAGMEEAFTSGALRLDADTPGDVFPTADAIGDDAPEELVRFIEDPVRRAFPETMGVFFERFSWNGFPKKIPRTYLKNTQDRMVPPDLQDRMIENMGGAHVIELDAPHCPEVRYPDAVAAHLNAIAAGLLRG